MRLQEENFVAREGDVEEESDPGVWKLLAHHAGNEHEMVIVDPDQVSRLVFSDDRLREFTIDLLVSLPVVAVELTVLLKVME